MQMEVGGVRVQVIELTQRHVYADVIEGVPNAQINRDIVERTVQRTNGPTHLVTPAQRRVSTDPKSDKQSLPPIACSARVRGPAEDADAEHAEAWIVWFQDAVSTTVSPEAAKALQTVRWHDIATDEYW